MAKTRFSFLTVLVASVAAGAADLEVVRRHTSLRNAKRYAEGRNAESKENGNGNEYGIIFRPAKDGKFDPTIELSPETVGAEASSKTGGKSRYPAATVTVTKDGYVDDVVKLHTSPANALQFATGANAEAQDDGSKQEYAILLRTATKAGGFPVIKTAK